MNHRTVKNNSERCLYFKGAARLVLRCAVIMNFAWSGNCGEINVARSKRSRSGTTDDPQSCGIPRKQGYSLFGTR